MRLGTKEFMVMLHRVEKLLNSSWFASFKELYGMKNLKFAGFSGSVGQEVMKEFFKNLFLSHTRKIIVKNGVFLFDCIG